jgi:2-polyprenyl-6-methoxyphenol hydroxylase-like FAD-dependent oxidoreductase
VSSSTNAAAASLLKELSTELVVVGGDALVPPNPLAAYGATLACEAAASLVALATAVGHVNAMVAAMDQFPHEPPTADWTDQLRELTTALRWHYEARSRSETYFQFVQTLICNVYSLPPFDK